MTSAIEAARQHLREEYASLLGSGFDDFVPRPTVTEDRPAWVPVDAYLAPVEAASAAGASLVDPEIGICLYLLPFTCSEEMKTALRRALVVRSGLLREVPTTARVTDRRGAWRVVVHWLLDQAQLAQWLESAASL